MPARTIMERTTSTASYSVSAATAAGGALSLNELALILGIIFAGLTFFINWWYQKRQEVRLLEKQAEEAELRRIEAEYKAAHDLREQEYHAARMAALNMTGGNDER